MTDATIVTSGRQVAGRVIGVCQCGVNPVCHNGRSISSQRLMGVQKFCLVTVVRDAGSGRHHKTLPVHLPAQALAFSKRLLVPERGVANTCTRLRHQSNVSSFESAVRQS